MSGRINEGQSKETASPTRTDDGTPAASKKDSEPDAGKRSSNTGGETNDKPITDVPPNGCIKPEQYYACDRQVAKTLAQYVSPEDRRKTMLWLDTLQMMTLDEDELSERSMYLTCLVMLLKSGQLVPPFTRTPPKRPLKSLRDVIDRRLFKKAQIECRKRRVYEPARYEQPDRSVAQKPTDFFDQMPAPYNGILCYGAAFSSM